MDGEIDKKKQQQTAKALVMLKCFVCLCFSVWAKLKSQKALERWQPDTEVSPHLRSGTDDKTLLSFSFLLFHLVRFRMKVVGFTSTVSSSDSCLYSGPLSANQMEKNS